MEHLGDLNLPVRPPPHAALYALDLQEVFKELDELYVDIAAHGSTDPALFIAVDRLVKSVKSDLAVPAVWNKLEVLDQQSWPIHTCQWSVYYEIGHLRLDYMEGKRGTAAEVNEVFNKIQGIIARGCYRAGQLSESERQEVARSRTTPLELHAAIPRAGVARTHSSLPFFVYTSALQELRPARLELPQNVALRRAVDQAIHYLESAVPLYLTWQDLAVIKPQSNPPVSYQQVILSQLESVSTMIGRGSLHSPVLLTTHVQLILHTIAEAKLQSSNARRAASQVHPLAQSQTLNSLSHHAPAAATALITRHRAARYGTTPEALARRWA